MVDKSMLKLLRLRTLKNVKDSMVEEVTVVEVTVVVVTVEEVDTVVDIVVEE